MDTPFNQEIAKGRRFQFGKNWSNFLNILDNERIQTAVTSLKNMLDVEDLHDRTFLDIGSGSGLFSLAACKLGATVHSFDYDPLSVACTKELKRIHFPNNNSWVIEQGSVLDRDYLSKLGQFDIVYAWGVLHHTGNMRQALDNTVNCVRENGRLFISIYNDQGNASKRWRAIKKFYNRSSLPLQFLLLLSIGLFDEIRTAFIKAIRFKNPLPFKEWSEKKKKRGMGKWYDLVDWVGGYPFEVAKPEEIFTFYKSRGFILEKLKTVGGSLGCNEFVFEKQKV